MNKGYEKSERLHSARYFVDKKQYLNIDNDSSHDDYDEYKVLLGDILTNQFTDENGNIKSFGYLPYDSYVIEVVDNKMFSGLCSIYHQNSLDNSNLLTSKCLALKPQKKSFLSLVVNSKPTLPDQDPLLISGASIFIIRKDYSKNNEDINDSDSTSLGVKVEENKNKEADTQTNIVETTPGSRLTALQDPKKHPLLKTLKKLDKTCDEALEILADIMRDSTADVSNRRQAAQFLVDRKIQVAQEINKDSLARVIAESRMLLAEKQAMREKVLDDDEGEDTPLVGYEPTVILKAPMDISNIKSL